MNTKVQYPTYFLKQIYYDQITKYIDREGYESA